MRAHDPPAGADRRRFRPSLDGLEARELLSHGPTEHVVMSGHRASGVQLNLVEASEANTANEAAASGGVLPSRGQQTGTPAWVDESLLKSLADQLHGPVTTTQSIEIGNNVFPPGTYATPQPTPAEIRRETFWVAFPGTYSVGPPRFTNQSATIHIYSQGNATVSNQFLKGRSQIVLFPPADPSATPTVNDPVAGQTVGLATIFTSNFLQTGDNLFLDLTTQADYSSTHSGGPSYPELPGIVSDDPAALNHGLPSKVYFLLDSDGAGAYTQPAYATTPAVQTVFDSKTGSFSKPLAVPTNAAGAVGYTTNALVGGGVGIVELRYFPTSRARGGETQTGKVVVRIQGVINMPGGVLNATARSIN